MPNKAKSTEGKNIMTTVCFSIWVFGAADQFFNSGGSLKMNENKQKLPDIETI